MHDPTTSRMQGRAKRPSQLATVLLLSCVVCLLSTTTYAEDLSEQVPVELPSDATSAAESSNEEYARARRIGTFVPEDVTWTCDLALCDTPEFESALRDIIAIHPGVETDGDAVARALRRLDRTQYFEQISFDLVGGVLSFGLHGATIIRRVEIDSGAALESVIRRRLSFRSGSRWSDDPETVRLQEVSLKEYFERRGFYNAEVEIRSEEVEDPSSPGFTVDVYVDVDRGERITIRDVYLRGLNALTYDEVRGILLGEFNFLRAYQSTTFNNAADAVIRHYREQGFLEARLAQSSQNLIDGGDFVDLYIDIDEGERWTVQVLGNRTFNDQRIQDASRILELGLVDATELRSAERRIRELYETRGHFFVGVEIEQRVDPDGGRALTFRIDEGSVSEIRSLEFEGNTVFSETELRELMSTSAYDLVTRGGYLQRARLDADIQRIVASYRERGYPAATVTRVVFVAENNDADLHVTVYIDEQTQAHVGEFEIQQPDAARTDDTAIDSSTPPELSMTEGSLFQQDQIAQDREKIATWWSQRGYGSVEVSTECSLEGITLPGCRVSVPIDSCLNPTADDEETSCSIERIHGRTVEECFVARDAPQCTLNAATLRVDIKHTVVPGEISRIGHVFVRGNFRTRDYVLIGEIPFTGPCAPERRRVRHRTNGFRPPDTCRFDRRILLQGQSNIRALGLYDSVRMEIVGPDEDSNVATVILSVEEPSFRTFEYRPGVDALISDDTTTQIRLTNELSYRDINLAGTGTELRLVGGLDIELRDPGRIGEGEFDYELRAIYFNPRTRLFGILTKPWQSRIELSWVQERLALAPAPQTRTLALEMVLRDSLRRFEGVFFEIGLSIRGIGTLDQSQLATSDRFEGSVILSILPRITIERRDNPLNPSSGYFGEFELEIADNFLQILGSTGYTRLTTRHSGYLPVGPFVVALNGRVGFGFGGPLEGFGSSGELALPLSERFFLGGVSSLRGYGRDTVPTVGTDRPGGDFLVNGNFELRYPLFGDMDVYGAIFLDVGQLAANVGDFRFDELRYSTGFGLRWLIAGILPVILDYGVPLNRPAGTRFGRLHFNVGYTF